MNDTQTADTNDPLLALRTEVVAAMRQNARDLQRLAGPADPMFANSPAYQPAMYGAMRTHGIMRARAAELLALADEWEACGLPRGYSSQLRRLGLFV